MDTLLSPVGGQFGHIGPPPIQARKKDVRPATSKTTNSSIQKLSPIRRSSELKKCDKVNNSYLRKLNLGLSFDVEAVHSSAPGALDYNQINRNEVYEPPTDVITISKRRYKGCLGRHNAIGDPILHLPCTLTIPEYSAKMRRSRLFCMKPFLKSTIQERTQEESIAAQLSTTTTTIQWDEYVLNKLSSETAGFIVNKHATGMQRDRLQRKVLGEQKEEVESVVFKDSQFMPVEPIITDRKHGIEQESSKISMASFSLSEIEEGEDELEDREDKEEEVEEYIPKYIGKPLQKNYMERFMTKAQRKREIGLDPQHDKYVSSQYNRNVLLSDLPSFTEDILQGRTSIHNPLTQSKIVFDQQTKYSKALIACYPQKPAIWGPKASHKTIRPLPKRGNRPWQDYPKLIITTYQRQVLESISDADSDKETVPGFSVQDFMESEEVSRLLLINALTTWRTTWYLDNKWRDSNIESILEDFNDISEHVRITAAIACGAGIGYRDDWLLEEPNNVEVRGEEVEVPISGYRTYSPSEPAQATQRAYQAYTPFETRQKKERERSMTSSVVDGLRKLVRDSSERVRVAAAVSLLTIGASNEKANTVLLDALKSSSTMEADSWAAVQCLAMENVTERIVIDKLIDTTQSVDQLVRHIATKLLVRLSSSSDVILFMVADELNNKLWTNRYMACKVIQKIKTPLNKDILHKLLTVMWSDYNENNKSVAAQTIGIKGHGHILHEELCCRLRNGNEHDRVDALERIVELKMMTGRMKSAFIKCFTDDHVSVRLTAAKGAGKLHFSDHEIIRALLMLISDDHAWKVKATAIEALADIGVVTDELVKQLVWSAQYQKHGQVRAAACSVLAMLNVTTEEVVNTLRDRLTADADVRVKRASTDALLALGMKPEKDASLIVAIKEAVKKLGTKDAILASIIKSDNTASQSELNSAGSSNGSGTISRLERKSQPSTIIEVLQLSKEISVAKSRGQSRDKLSRGSEFWPDPSKVLEAEDKRLKMEKIQALLKSHEPQKPNTGFTWKIT